jgi:uncharacterized protein Yka (UPF0111/DUF47 family)
MVQENLRLSGNQVIKLNNELKIVYNENEELKKMVKVMGEIQKKIVDYEGKIDLLSREI